MIPLSELRKAHKKREEEHTAVACDAADDEICTAEDPSKCRVHGIRRYEREGDYLDKLAHASEESEEARKKFNYFRDLANSMTMEEAEKELSSVFSVVCASEQDVKANISKLKPKQIALVETVFEHDLVEEVDEQTAIKTKKCVAATIRHLRNTTPIQLPKDVPLLIMRLKDTHKRGATFANSLDISDCCMAFSWAKTSGDIGIYNHGDYRDNYDYVRHEFWHLMDIASKREDAQFADEVESAIGKEKAQEKFKMVSQYAFDNARLGEAEPECFSMMTSNDYNGDLGSEIESIISKHMKGQT